VRGNVVTPQPTPFSTPKRAGQAINPEAAVVLSRDKDLVHEPVDAPPI